MSAAGQPLIVADRLTRIHARGSAEVRALDGVSFTIDQGEMVAIVGASGSGKSTLLGLLGCLDRPTSGSLCIDGRDTRELSDEELSHLRNREIGFVFQSYHLIASLSAIENVELPLFYSGMRPRERRRRAQSLLDRLGLSERADHHPDELSGGQCQRVAIARALATDPPLLLADEPTGNLDSQVGAATLALLDELSREGRTILIVTHDLGIAERSPRRIVLKDGHIDQDSSSTPAA